MTTARPRSESPLYRGSQQPPLRLLQPGSNRLRGQPAAVTGSRPAAGPGWRAAASLQYAAAARAATSPGDRARCVPGQLSSPRDLSHARFKFRVLINPSHYFRSACSVRDGAVQAGPASRRWVRRGAGMAAADSEGTTAGAGTSIKRRTAADSRQGGASMHARERARTGTRRYRRRGTS